ncbi:mucin-12-like [Venturia canescens]|uniref:mucin-12-like n=1 Tax=Venturia canescens TaxID=32260 RepID=UPI001C9C2465|nr:mucin-12-like [Venturia canescens]
MPSVSNVRPPLRLSDDLFYKQQQYQQQRQNNHYNNERRVTTVLLVPARPGKSAPPVGLLTKTARTFVQDGASTEYATQVLGTTLDNGRLYARILSTSSRVFYEKEPPPESVSPFVVYPSRAPQDEWQLRVDLENTPVKIAKDLLAGNNYNTDVNDHSNDGEDNGSGSDANVPSERENDIFNKRELNIVDNHRFKPAKVRAAENLPTYTVKQEYSLANGPSDNVENQSPRSFRPRVPKIFKHSSSRITTTKKVESRALATVTYHGFADFTTIVGDTVIVFSPSTSPAPVGRAATTIKGDATLRPDDGIGILIQPTSVVHSHDRTSRPAQDQPRDQLLDAINGGRSDSSNENYNGLQPSRPSELEGESSSKITDPILVPLAENGSPKPTGLLKTLDSTTALDGTTTIYKSLIYGTYIGTNYAQVIHTSSNVYFFPDEATVSYNSPDTTLDYSSADTEPEEPEKETTLPMPKPTTPKPSTRPNKIKSQVNEITTPYRETTESIFTTLKDILANAKKRLSTTTESPSNEESNIDSEITNDIATGDPQGRSIKGSSPKNNFAQGSKDKENNQQEVSFATRLLPSTVYKTFTYFTTFFVPDGDRTTTSVKSREVVSSEVTYLTELILPSATVEPSQSTILNQEKNGQKESTTSRIITTTEEPEEEQTTKQDEEIELIFKTLYTTYTYLTTFFQESTSSISSREVVETNVVTQTVGPNGISEGVAGLFDRDESVVILATSVTMMNLPSVSFQPGEDPEEQEPFTTEATGTTLDETTDNMLTTIQDQETTINDSTDSTTFDDEENSFTNLEPSPTPSLATEVPKGQVKTYFTTYTYFTTIFVDDETEIETRTEVFTNVVTEGIQPTAVAPVPVESSSVTTPKSNSADKPVPPPEILAYLEALQRQKSQDEALQLAKKVQEEKQHEAPSAQGTTINDFTTEAISDGDLATYDERYVTEKTFTDNVLNAQVTPNPPVEGEVIGSMITDVISSSSSGGGTVLGVMDKRNAVPEDQELSESNHHDVESAPTLLLQTSYTTFTYFTTMYKGDATNVVSRLDTVTNVVTETIRPTSVVPVETNTLPVTYFTTFTYWTTFYKGGDTVTTSREETVSNVVTPGVSPTPTLELGVIMTYRPDAPQSTNDENTEVPKEYKVVADNEVTLSDLLHEKLTTEKIGVVPPKDILTLPESDKVEASTISPEPTTFYTTFTYFTTSYIGNETILNSRLETITSVALPETTVGQVQATGRAIGGGDVAIQTLDVDEKPKATVNENVQPTSKSVEVPKTGLISTIRSSKIADGTTTHFATDVYGTYIDGLYAQVVESTSRLETPSLSSSATPVLPTGVLSLNKGSIVDADEVTTVYFTTKQIGTLIDGLYAKVIESTSSTKIDADKKATIAPVQGHRTGLVRLIQGHIENNDVTTFYQSRVIGTSIDGRYAQIIESTSSFAGSTSTTGISPTSTLPPNAATGIPEISPSPAVIQSSLSEEATTESIDNEENDSSEQNEEGEDGDEDEEDEDGQKSRKKSRLTFSSRKRTFTPVIRPFLSRSRPTFNPKRKGAQAATTITRTDITPTITATLAGKGNRFASTRGRVSSPIGPYSSTLSSSGSRRFSGRGRTASTLSPSSTSGFPSGSSRGRGASSRIAPSSTFPANRRGPSSIRGSSIRPGPRGSSSVYPGVSSRFRPGIRPSSTLNKIQPTARHEDQDDEANEFSATTLTTEETLHTEYEESTETVTTPLQTTTESSRRSTNPLLRFRRPLNLSAGQRTVVTPRVPVATTTGRSRNLARQTNVPTALNRGSIRAGPRPTPPIVSRSRPGGQLFPPRGLLNKKSNHDPIEEPVENNEEFEGEEEENFEDDPVEEIADNDYEGSEDAATTTRYTINRRQGKAASASVSIRPFGANRRGRRVRRQASQLRSLTNRFRKPASSGAKAEDRSDTDVSSSREESSRSVAPTKQSSRYSARGRSLTSARPSGNSPRTSSEKISSESGESLVKPRLRTSPRVKPSPTSSSGRQFTLREKDSSSRLSYKRPATTSSRNRSTGKLDTGLRTRPRGKSGSSRSTESPTNRRSSTRPSSRSSGRNSNRRLPQRGRGSYEDIRESPFVHKDNDGTITVTHYVPTEVTIPVVNNGITEQKNIVTAHPSTEVLGPDQYSTVVGGNGRPLVVIVSESTGSNAQGQLEITRFLLHETPTTRVSHTLTSLGGRRASQSIIIPSTVWSVENVVSTVQPSLSNDNGPLANILLSQLLLGQLNQQNPLLGGAQPQATPTTQYNTRTTSYVTTITKHQSTVIPLTFRGKEILTTLVDSSTDVVTATEFITDTVVVTPTVALPAAGLNSLLMLLQQPQQQQQVQHPLLDPLFAAAPLLTQSNTLPGEVERRNQPADFDYKPNYDDSEEEVAVQKSARSRVRTSNQYNDHKKAEKAAPAESSVVTLYVSGRRPGEFSTVLSTVKIGEEATISRRRRDNHQVQASAAPSLHAVSENLSHLTGSEELINAHAPTQSLESVVGDVGRHISTSIHA